MIVLPLFSQLWSEYDEVEADTERRKLVSHWPAVQRLDEDYLERCEVVATEFSDIHSRK